MIVCVTCGVNVSQHLYGWKHNNHPRSGVKACDYPIPVKAPWRRPWVPKKRNWKEPSDGRATQEGTACKRLA